MSKVVEEEREVKCPKCGKMLKDEIYTSIEGEE